MNETWEMSHRLISAAVLMVATASVALAGATTPTLLIESASASSASAGPRTAVFDVTYDYSNAIQADYDLELILFQGQAFARYPLSGVVQVGSSAALADGLTAADLPALDAAAFPAPPAVRIVTLEPTRITVALPPAFATGSVRAVFVATVDEGTILSNPLDFVLP